MDMHNNLLHHLQAEDFALYETALYLDSHPCDKKALQYYQARKKNVEMLRGRYEKEYGPLTLYGNRDDRDWDWTELPWPWEKEAN